MRIFSTLLSRTALLMIGSGTGLILAIAIILYAANRQPGLPDSALLFIGLVITLLLGLVMAAALYRGLGYDQLGSDAFGLPNGSIRALLGVALMALLVVFGLPFLRPEAAPLAIPDQPLATATIACADVPGEVARYRREGLIAVSNVSGCKPLPAGPVAASELRTGTVTIFRQSHEWPASQLELNKQTLTAIITLLTTVIGFYFGSASTAAGQAKLIDKIAGTDANPEPEKAKSPPDPNPGPKDNSPESFKLF